LLCGALFLTACASVEPKYIAASNLAPAYHHPYKVHVQIAHYADQSHIRDHGLRPQVIVDAIRLSIESSKLFTAVVPASEADYILSLTVNPIHPTFQMGPTVWYMSHIIWKLTEASNQREVYGRTILYAKSSTAAARGRGVMAQEGAFHGNIRQALQDIGSFDISKETKNLPTYEKNKGDPG